MQIRFWGTRGSIAKAGPTTVRYGGNTSCVEVRSRKGTLLVLDCGTGAHGLGASLLADQSSPREGHILISHTHWDHIQGMPFFAPLFVPGQRWSIYGPGGLGHSITDVIAGQMEFTYFPITQEKFEADVSYHDLIEGHLEIDDIRITAQYLNHPGLTLGYRIEADGVTVVYATDHEPHLHRLACGGVPPEGSDDERHGRLMADADLVIHDTQYTAQEYPDRVGWGHSTMEYVVDMSRAAAVRRVAMFHHDPMRDDDALDALLGRARERAATGSGPRVEVLAAAEGRTIELQACARRRPVRAALAADAEAKVVCPQGSVLVVGEPGEVRTCLRAAVVSEGWSITEASTFDDARASASREVPILAVLPRILDGRDCLVELASMQQAVERAGVPLVIYGSGAEVEPPAEGAAMVAAWLEQPFSEQYVRARIRALLLSKQLRWQRARRPADDEARVRAVHQLGLLGTEPEERFDRFTRLATALFRVPLAFINLVSEEHQFCKSRPDWMPSMFSRDASVCAHAILGGDLLEIPDAHQDERYADNPIVAGKPHLRFYAGVPLRHEGHAVGTLCIGDMRPRRLDDSARARLIDLARLVEEELTRS